MHIKKVVINGFKSYLHATNEELFTPGVNAIVGVNGSGKSNFFEAIRFVLSESLTNLRADERQQLLFERAGKPAFEAQVAIHFDNSRGRFPIDKDEIVLRRVIGRSKEGYYCINDKRVSKQEVVSLLESAGFSRSNPYYIVQQGKVNDLTLMKDKERLNLLKEVAGTRVYEEKKQESLKLIRDGDNKREKSEELLNYIEERLNELKEEKEELQAYELLDKQKRAVEYNLYQSQLESAETNLEKLQDLRSEETRENAGAHEAVSTKQAEIKQKERDMKQLGNELQILVNDKVLLNSELQELITQKTKLELCCGEANESLDDGTSSSKTFAAELKKLEAEIAKVKKNLDDVTSKYQDATQNENATAERLSTCETRLNALYSKMGRSAQYSNKKERDVAISNELKNIEKTIIEKQKQTKEIEDSIRDLVKNVKEKSSARDMKEKEIAGINKSLDRVMKQCTSLRRQRDTYANERKEFWRQDAEIEAEINGTKEELSMHERALYSTLDRATFTGLQAVEKIVKENNISGYYGPLIDLFECPDSLTTAVEVTAGTALFFVVVDTDETASRIIEIMNTKRAGRVTFMPLNRLTPNETDMPRRTDDYFPLISVLKEYLPMFKPAMLQVFGRTLLCRDLDVASSFARTQNLDCVTELGDKINKKGALTGGYYDVHDSRCQRHKKVSTLKRKLATLQNSSESTKKDLESSGERVRNVMEQLQVAESELQQHQRTIEELTFEIRILAKDSRLFASSIEQREKNLSEQQLELNQLQTTTNELQAEQKTQFQSQLSSNEKKELTQLNKEITKLQETYINDNQTRTKLETQKDQLQNLLSSNLLKRQEELQQKLSGTSLASLTSSLEQYQSELKQICDSLETANRRYTEMEGNIAAKTAQLSKIKDEIESAKEETYEQVAELQNKTKNIESLFNKRSLYLQQKEENLRKIRELGSLPDGHTKYSKYSHDKLMKVLHQTNEKLRKYSHVNKKALDQWNSFTNQKKELTARMADLNSSKEAIDMLIETLDRQKDEAICLTLKGVSARFRETFKQLVPNGRAELSVVIGSDGDDSSEEDSEEDSISNQVRRYQGVSIEAAFSEGEALPVELLSGGQKAVTALALIFAIQKCDPAPFYLFDEIDAALDPVYRTAVAQMVAEQANAEGNNAAQFIISTFKPELLQCAEKFFAIRMEDLASSFTQINKVLAEGIIEQEAEEIVTYDHGDSGASSE